MTIPSLSGPRWTSVLLIAASRAGSTAPFGDAIPQIPHIRLSLVRRYATLPSTYLVTDIEGSRKLPPSTVAEAQSFVEQALSASGGRIVLAEDDAVVAWFGTVAEAVRAATAARNGSTVKISFGIAPSRRVAERVCDVGHGGQILLSWSARRALGRSLRRVGLGLYQLDPDAEFPPPRRGLLRRLV
jgi:hypothetical protein